TAECHPRRRPQRHETGGLMIERRLLALLSARCSASAARLSVRRRAELVDAVDVNTRGVGAGRAMAAIYATAPNGASTDFQRRDLPALLVAARPSSTSRRIDSAADGKSAWARRQALTFLHISVQ